MQVETDNRRRCIGLYIEHAGFHREHREQITVRMIALGWTWPAVAGRAEIGACLQCARRQLAARTADALGKFAHIGGNIHQQPVPEA